MKLLSTQVFFLWLAAAFSGFSTPSLASESESFLDPEYAFQPAVSLHGEQLQVHWQIEDGYFLYRHGFKIEAFLPGGNHVEIPYDAPTGQRKFDEFLEREVEIYHSATTLTAEMSPYVGRGFDIAVTSQGCADKGLCFPPTSYRFRVSKSGEITTLSNTSNLGSKINVGGLPLQGTPTSQKTSFSEIVLTLIGALLGGLILNLMPCVFPVLSLKALSFASGHESKATLRKHGWSYTLGVVASFLFAATAILAARSAGQTLGWGFQLQHPVFVALMAYLFFVMALSLSGAIELGGSFMGIGQKWTTGNSVQSSFFTGVLAALVASPCTAPFMATALGVALTQSAPISLLIFAALGMGMALPFLALSYSPALSRWMPKPGAWMEKFKQALSFPMYLTVIWLLWVLSHQSSSDTVILTLVGMLLIFLTLWIRGLSAQSKRVDILKNGLALVVFVPALLIVANMESVSDSHGADAAETFTFERLDHYRSQGTPVFVDLTADWCLTCKVNEKVALTPSVKAQLKEHGVIFLVGDWTNKNSEIAELLKRHNRSGIPLYLMYPEGGGEPELLPQLLSESIVENAMGRALL
ncbi:protein-disulfide reductase DsbD family protein [Marinimicrobium agarilyticum]|uniref:protein-disulfide reductase DsbD family protein n=1 Tax=Marinimicrobium agarilyticum TaxID=306546 RepID=UPI00040A65BB|nr:protein-disulfide reductase DsbD [Marinimicrobium agarilyticum]